MPGGLLQALIVIEIGVLSLVLPQSWVASRRNLRSTGRRLRVDFGLDGQPGYSSSSAVEARVRYLVTRQLRAVGWLALGLGSTLVLLIVSPPLSTSTPASVALAAAESLIALGPLLAILPLFDPVRYAADGPMRLAAAEDYLDPGRRSLLWVVATAVLVIPAGALVLGLGPHYDVDKIFWEGMLAVPVSVVVAVAVLEHRWRGISDDTRQPAMLVLVDGLRSRAIGTVGLAVLLAAGISFASSSQVIVGVSLDPSYRPSWLVPTRQALAAMQPVCFALGVLFLLRRSNRLLGRLWQGLLTTERIPWQVSAAPLRRPASGATRRS